MKQAKIKKLMAVLLAATMTMGVVACGNEGNTEKTKESENKVDASASLQESSTPEVSEEAGVTFPLKEEVTFDIGVIADRDTNEMAELCQMFQDLYEATNVKINLVTLPIEDGMSNLNALFTTGKEPDALFPYWISDADMSNMASNGLLIPLDEYLTEDLMPNLVGRIFAENPATKGIVSMQDGHVYALPKYKSNQGSYLEGPFWINKNWVEQAGWKVEDIKTIDDLETVLTYFRDNDMNGNGIMDDEIPYIMTKESSANHTEAFMGLYGIPTKDSEYENYVFVEDGVVKFAPLTQNWKDAVKKLNDWYEKDLIWKEVFTGTWDTYKSKQTGEEVVIGLWNAANATQTGADQYVQLAPVSVEGYETRWAIHPGIIGMKSGFSVTRSCENVDILMAWMDQLYSFENSVRANYGEEKDGRWGYTSEGLVEFYTLDADTQKELNETVPTLAGVFGNSYYEAFTAEDFVERIFMGGNFAVTQASYDLYEEFLTDEPWPRPYFAGEYSARLVELRTDIFTTLNLKRAEWITGVADIDAEYDAFVEDMKRMGIEEFIAIMQDAYEGFNAQASK